MGVSDAHAVLRALVHTRTRIHVPLTTTVQKKLRQAKKKGKKSYKKEKKEKKKKKKKTPPCHNKCAGFRTRAKILCLLWDLNPRLRIDMNLNHALNLRRKGDESELSVLNACISFHTRDIVPLDRSAKQTLQFWEIMRIYNVLFESVLYCATTIKIEYGSVLQQNQTFTKCNEFRRSQRLQEPPPTEPPVQVPLLVSQSLYLQFWTTLTIL